MARVTSHSGPRVVRRRSFLRSAACAGLCSAAAPALNVLAVPANAAANWRGQVGCVKPTNNNSSLVDMIRLLPPGIGVVPAYLNVTESTREEYQNRYANYEKSVAYLASVPCDIISIEGAPPFMILGRRVKPSLSTAGGRNTRPTCSPRRKTRSTCSEL